DQDEIGESNYWLITVRAKRALIILQEVAVHVDDTSFRERDDELRVGFECTDTLREELRLAEVVMSRLLEVLASCEFIDTEEIRARTHVARISMVVNTLVASGVVATDLLSTICGGIVRDQDLKICERLSDIGIESLGKKSFSVINRHSNRKN